MDVILFLLMMVPGYLAARILFPHDQTYVRVAVTVGSALFLLPVIIFFFAWVLDILISGALIAFVCVGMTIPLVLMSGGRPRFTLNRVFMVVCILIFGAHFLTYAGPAQDYWSTYIVAGSMFMAGDPVTFLDIDGNELYAYSLGDSIRENMIDDSYGIITKDQRIGASIVYAPYYVMFGLGGFRIMHALSIVIAFCCVYAFIRSLGKPRLYAYLGGLIVALNPLLFYFNRPNANVLAMTLVAIILFLLVRRLFFVGGCFLGALGGVRNVALLLVPGFAYLILTYRGRFRKLMLFAVGALLFVLPVLLWKSFAFGDMLAHPSQYEGLEGHRPEFGHSLLGYEFSFNGMFNYPLHDRVVRTPHFPFPNFLTMPLLVLKSLGLLLFGLFAVGLVTNKRWWALVMFLPFFLFLMVQENWEELKSSFVLMLLPLVAYFCVVGLLGLVRSRGARYWYGAILAGVIVFVLMLHQYQAPLDDRWYERFPHSAEGMGLAHDDRLSWEYFYTNETLREHERMRALYLDLSPAPAFYSRPSLNLDYTGARNLTTLEIWNYIY
ncbi:MAG: hypothetical protein ACQESG_00050 [Nanobdellota archaeon]